MRLFVILVFSALLASCAHNPDHGQYEGDVEATALDEKPLNLPGANTQSPKEDINEDETDMRYLPKTMNEAVNRQIEHFQGPGRKHMKRYLSRSSRYLPKMKEILRSHGLPEDLVYMALIESGFSPRAISRAGAVGYWQFIRGTGRRYGLQQNYYVDERRDFISSTEAAAKYLKALYNLYGSWYLAIASYNVGENRIKNLVMRHYTRDFFELARKKVLPRETTNYVPRFLAARLIAKHPDKYGFDDVVYEPPLDFKEITFDKGVHLKKLASNTGISYKELKNLNPAYKRGIIPHRKGGTKIRVPTNVDDKVILAALQKSKSTVKMNVYAAGQYRKYRIRRGDTLSHIAQRFGTSIRALRQANNLGRRSRIYPGKRLKIPTGRLISSHTSRSVAVKAMAGEKVYTVRSGDSLYKISKKFGVTISQLKKRNKLGRRSMIREGAQIVIPSKGGASYKRGKSRYHVVRRGDNLTKIAQKYRVSLPRLTAANSLGRRSKLLVGKRLLIPR